MPAIAHFGTAIQLLTTFIGFVTIYFDVGAAIFSALGQLITTVSGVVPNATTKPRKHEKEKLDESAAKSG